MDVIVPLAGPDLIGPDGTIKSLETFRGQPLIKEVLENRPWHDGKTRYIFVLQNIAKCHDLYSKYLGQWFRNSEAVFLSKYTKGAALSALSGLSLKGSMGGPFVVDLADIYFETNSDFELEKFKSGSYQNGAFTFQSNKSQYSYLDFDKNGNFLKAVEKVVVSDRASAGVYYFENTNTYVEALSWYLKNGAEFRHNSLYYVCPMLNGVAKCGGVVTEISASAVFDLKF